MRKAFTLILNLLVVTAFAQWGTSGTNIYYNLGNVGIGTSTPTSGKLQVIGNIYATDYISARQYITVTASGGGGYRVSMNGQSDGYIVGRNVALETKFQFHSNGISFLNGGNVGIGTVNPDAKLTVKGTIHTEEVKVDLNGALAPDYVFEKDYSLPSLHDLAQFISVNKHLPEVPPAKEMEDSGINLKAMNLLLLKKVEELTLYMIEQNRKLELQQQQIEMQQELLEEQSEDIKNLKMRDQL